MYRPDVSSLLKNWDTGPHTLGIFHFVVMANSTGQEKILHLYFNRTLDFNRTLELGNVHKFLSRKGHLGFLKI